ncbi:MAG: glycine--tRNA ligase subunit beta [Deltaproteobacteria bacterium HGW-Deltaproteobacteria-8]|jgi:glycyl-tRNA synthetase beta chain|nr:MAG: glycine--tRNA ligase subunit beta [Deltaproteobacteria bacterium HGW-Deltaproteobacteria-8]
MSEFILEIGTEEMPARFVPRLGEELVELFERLLAEARIDHAGVRAFATPRRLVAHVSGLGLTQRLEEEIVSGPPVRIAYADGKLTKAGEGFAKTQGVAEADLFVQQTPKGEYLAAKKRVGGGRTLDILPALCLTALKGLNFPKRMKWGSLDFLFGRPLRWVLALLDADVVPLEIAGLASGRVTHGHRVLGPGPWAVDSAVDYFDTIRDKGNVVLDARERLDLVRAEGDRIAAGVGGSVVWDEALLLEVANLVEFPRPILGEFARLYLELPAQVLLTSMQSHQKSFGITGADGSLLPYFLTTLNIEPLNMALVKKGWERVLKARLEDARFFWEADLATDMDEWLVKLDSVVFLGPLGSMGDKSRRLEKLCARLAEAVAAPAAPVADMARAGRLAKADLMSELVYEFDSLQGVIGGIYARKKGEGELVGQAIAEQYLPAGPDSPVPATLTGALLAIADKADTMAGCFGLGMIPTGTADPYALRRAALGISRIIMEHGLRLKLDEVLGWAQAGYDNVKWKLSPADAQAKMLDFFGQRLRALFASGPDGSVRTDSRVADAALGVGFNDIRTLKMRFDALTTFSRQADFEQAVLTFKRAANIIRKQGGEAGVALSADVDMARLEMEQERVLAESLRASAGRFEELWAADDFAGLFAMLGELRPAVDAFFDNVMVMAEDADLRQNRLNILYTLVERLGRLADFGALQV